jgi:starvation-inducible DNA-binding protein
MDCRTEYIEIQEFDTVRDFLVGLARDTRLYSCKRLNQIIADTQILYALYKKHHWLMRGATFYADRQDRGTRADARRHCGRRPSARRRAHQNPPCSERLRRSSSAHETILVDAHDAAAKIAELGDDGSNDLIVSEVVRTGELEAWFNIWSILRWCAS